MRVSRDASRGFFVLAQTRLQAGGPCGSLRENSSGVDPHVLIARLHVEQKSFREPLRHGSDWSNGTSCSARARPAWMGGGRAKGCLGAHDALLAGMACATGNSKDGDSALPRWWKCLTPISDEEAPPTSNVCCDVDRRAVLTPRCSLLLPPDPPLPQNRFRKRNWMTVPRLAAWKCQTAM